MALIGSSVTPVPDFEKLVMLLSCSLIDVKEFTWRSIAFSRAGIKLLAKKEIILEISGCQPGRWYQARSLKVRLLRVMRHRSGDLHSAGSPPQNRIDDRNPIRLALLLLALTLLPPCLSACGTARKVDISSTPPGAQVLALDGSVLGQTPLSLTDEKLERATLEGKLALRLESPGYLERELLLDLSARDTHSITLTPQSSDYFKKALLSDHALNVNELTRELLQIHGLLINQKTDEAEKRILSFQQMYPSVAASHVMLAQVLSKRGKSDEARTHLLRALKLDPNDPVASRTLLGVSKPAAAAAQATTSATEVPVSPQSADPALPADTSASGNPVYNANEGGPTQ
jgi:tetratricopeptide (TPR) repeat protein